MKVKKRILIFVFTAMMVIVATACEKNDNERILDLAEDNVATETEITPPPNNSFEELIDQDWEAIYKTIIDQYREAENLPSQECIEKFFGGIKPEINYGSATSDFSWILLNGNDIKNFDGVVRYSGMWRYGLDTLNETKKKRRML